MGGDIITINAASYLNFDGLSFLYSRSNGKVVWYIMHQLFYNAFSGMVVNGQYMIISNVNSSCNGGTGIILSGSNIQVVNSTLTQLGCKGVQFSCGDTTHLIDGG